MNDYRLRLGEILNLRCEGTLPRSCMVRGEGRTQIRFTLLPGASLQICCDSADLDFEVADEPLQSGRVIPLNFET